MYVCEASTIGIGIPTGYVYAKMPAKDRGSGIFGISVQFFRAMSPEKIGTTLYAG